MFRIITWNVNSIKMREERTLKLLEKQKPDILCLQELKCVEEAFPESISKAGYHCSILGQKTYNGVAILSKNPAHEVTRKLNETDTDARLISAKFGSMTIYSAYIPNGQEVGSEKYAYKLAWYESLINKIKANHHPTDAVLICGDFNVAPHDLDVYDPSKWKDQILCSEKERGAFEKLIKFGFVDCFRGLNPHSQEYSWWDYRAMAFPLNHGLRIDFVLATESLYKACTSAKILRDERVGVKPSDHVPVVCDFSISN